MTVNVVVRTDASTEIGTGHVMRCLSLAEQLRDLGARICFASADVTGNLIDHIQAEGYRTLALDRRNLTPEGFARQLKALDRTRTFDLLIVDHYAIERRWEAAMRDAFRRIVVIDDLANREHECDLLVDQTPRPEGGTAYADLVPPHCDVLIGAQYCLLRRQFLDVRNRLRPRVGDLRKILIGFGGYAPIEEVSKVLEACVDVISQRVSIDLIGGRTHHFGELAMAAASLPNCRYRGWVENMAAFMSQADLGIGAGGISTWERCCVGLPSLAVRLTEDQQGPIEAASRAGAVVDLGGTSVTTVEAYRRALSTLDRATLARMSRAGIELVDGLGARRVAVAALASLTGT